MERHEKEEMVASLNAMFSQAQTGFLVDYRGLTVEEVTELRGKLRDASSTMRVLKNRLAKLAIQETPFAAMADQLVGTRALVVGDDPVGPAKVVSDFAKTNENLQFITALLVKGDEVDVLDETGLKKLAALPSREQLTAQFLGLLQAPSGKLVRTLAEVPSKFVRTLAAINEAKEGGS